jgi:hypothetical protein
MKGVIITCLQEMVCSRFGTDKWDKSLAEAGFPASSVLQAVADVQDASALRLLAAVCRTLGLELPQLADAFGDYWVNVYSPKLYKAFYERNPTARDFLLDMDRVHVAMTKSVPNASPPRFEYEWTDARTLVMTYRSERGLVDLVVGLAKGVGTYYGEPLEVTKLGPDRVRVVFLRG